ncbi:MAG: redoxin domain-containing protein [Chloroflexi bacterium]|nr:redoxin domain-containing protein [Chloroflexota bacterium]
MIPSLKEWQAKYGAQGLTIIGVHAPEFDYEKVQANVEQAIKRFGLSYRVALDNDFRNWNAYHNRYWPAFYLIDKEGYIRFVHIGEGDEEKVEAVIRQLLAE